MSDPRFRRNPLTSLREGQVPESVGITLERNRDTLERTLDGDDLDALVDSLIGLRMQGADAAMMSAIVERLATIAPRMSGAGGLQAWLTAVREVATQARPCTLAMLESSDEILRHGSPAELLMWTRIGLREAHRTVDGRDETLRAHFELRSRQSSTVARPDDERIDFASNKPRLVHLLRALFDRAPALLTVEQGLATRRAFLSNLGIHLPEAGRALRGRSARRWYDATAAHAAAHLVHSTHRFERRSLKPIQTALLGVLEDARVEALAISELPGLRRLWLDFHVADASHGNTFVVLMLRLARGLLDRVYEDPHPWVAKGRRLFDEATRGGSAPCAMTPSILRDIASRLGNDIGQMRLQFNHREYIVEPSYRDDNAHLWMPDTDAQPQVQPVADELPVPPEDDDAPEVDQDDDSGEPMPRPRRVAGIEAPADQSPIARFQYPEWDRLVGDYRPGWCTVLQGHPPRAAAARLQARLDAHAPLLARLQKVLRAGRLRERMKLRAQLRGDDLDVDAAVRAAIDRRARHPPAQKVHQRFERRHRDLATLVLLDTSTSTADIAPGAGCTVLDLAREAALLTTRTLAEAGDRCAIHAFCSNGRHEVRYESVLHFDETIGPTTLARLAGLRSRLSTRMGAALRHATSILGAQRERRRLLLFITDGEPHDIDVHDRRYLVDDARRAVLEAGRRGLAVFCVSLDSGADEYVRSIFGAANYRILDRIENLPRILPTMVMRLTR